MKRTPVPLSPKRGSGFATKEVDFSLELIGTYLPLCPEEWDTVHREHQKCYPQQQRSVDSLKRKFSSLHRKKMPTGDPLMPEDVRRAKNIRHEMTERANLGDAEDAEDEASSLLPNEEDNDDNLVSGARVIGGMEDYDEDTPGPSAVLSATRRVDAPQVTSPDAAPPPRARGDNPEDLMSMFKVAMLQEQQRREDEARRREEERREERERREEERSEDRLRREQESKRQDRFMEMLLLMATNSSNNGGGALT